MVRVTLGLVLALVFAIPLLAAENAVEEGWQTYIDDTYKVTLRFRNHTPLYTVFSSW